MSLREQAFKSTQILLKSFEDRELKNMNLHALMLEQVEKGLIEAVLIRCEFNQLWAANILGIARNTLRKKMELLNIKAKKSSK